MGMEKPKEKITSETIDRLLIGDYPQCGPYTIINHLDMVSDGLWDEENFFDKTPPERIKTIEEWLKGHCERRNLEYPEQIDPNVQEKIDQINAHVKKLREALARRISLKELYDLAMAFSDTGIRMDPLPEYE